VTDPLPVITKVASCVDCATTLIGERLRCPACHDRHAVGLLSGDEDMTLPRDRVSRPLSIWNRMFAWFLIAQLATIVVLLLVLAGRGCL